MAINSVSISGNLTRDPDMRQAAGGLQVMTFGVAVNERRKNNQTGEWDDYANFIDCTVFGDRAQSLGRILCKGMKVCIHGKLRYTAWERDGQKRSKVEVIADTVEFMSQRSEGGESKQNRQQPSQGAAYVQATPIDYEIPF